MKIVLIVRFLFDLELIAFYMIALAKAYGSSIALTMVDAIMANKLLIIQIWIGCIIRIIRRNKLLGAERSVKGLLSQSNAIRSAALNVIVNEGNMNVYSDVLKKLDKISSADPADPDRSLVDGAAFQSIILRNVCMIVLTFTVLFFIAFYPG